MKKVTIFLLCLAMCLSLFAGCSDSSTVSAEKTDPEAAVSDEGQNVQEDIPTETAVATDVSEPTEESEEHSELPEPGADFPLVENGDVTITMWYATPPFASMMGDYADNNSWHFFQELSSLTGLNFEFTYAPFSSADESFSLHAAGGDYTDVFCGNRYVSGVDAAIDDDVYLRLNELIDEYCPYYAAQLERPEVKKDAVTEGGNIGVFYALYDQETVANSGIGINEDTFAATGVSEPETYDDYTEMFRIMKDNGVTKPVIQSPFHQIISSGYNNIDGWIVVDGKVQYGLVNDQSKEFYTLMADWYAKGYLMSDYYTTTLYDDQNAVFAELTGHTGGIIYTAADAIGAYPDAKVKPLHVMVQNAGDIVHTYSRDQVLTSSSGWEISATCDPEKQVYIAKMIDYLYSEPGELLVTWGEEHVSFEYDENGDAQYIDSIFDEFPIGMCAYLKYATMNEVGLSDVRKVNYGLDEAELAAIDLWDTAQDNDGIYPNTSLTNEEQDVVNRYFADAETYITEYVNTLIAGSASIDTWEDFMDTLNTSLHFDEVVAVKQAAYDRYVNK